MVNDSRFGVGEWYGRLVESLSAKERSQFAAEARRAVKAVKTECPFRSTPSAPVTCNKKGGLCSVTLQTRSKSGKVSPAKGADGALRAVCPERFKEGGAIYQWVGEKILDCDTPALLGEVGFLTSILPDSDSDAGKIDSVLIVPGSSPLKWCALEIQAVYMSNSSLTQEYSALGSHKGGDLPFPVKAMRPDYRSSGPKRLMPQLQIKVPTLRRWGKKMAVVIDEPFFQHMGPMNRVDDISNADIAWFVVRFGRKGPVAELERADLVLTTLEDSITGLTAATPLALGDFEERLVAKAKQTHPTLF